jgi:integrase/recombinase XerD
LLFPTNRGTKLTIGSYETKLKKIAKKANIDNVFPHRLRATFAIQFLKNGGSIYVLSKLLGHSSIEVTQVYLDLTDKELQEQFLKYHPLKDLNI